MSYFLIKASLRRGQNAKLKKESFVTKSDDLIAAEQITATNLISVDNQVSITDINLKNYVDVFMLPTGDGPIYEVVLEFDDIDGKVIKEPYLQQANSTNEAETLLMENLSNPNVEIIKTTKTTIVDYFKEV